MAYRLLISIQAQADVVNAINHYGAISPTLVDRFLTELLNVYRKIAENPQHYSYISGPSRQKFRDVKLKTFPYIIVYEIKDMDVIVAAIFNTHQRPLI